MRMIKVATLMAVTLVLVVGGMHKTSRQSHRDEIDALLKKYLLVQTKEGDQVVIVEPSVEIQQEVPDSLLRIAKQTPESRAEVIEAMMQIVEDPPLDDAGTIAYKWTTAVDVLGELKASEAIDPLVRNLDQTGEHGVCISLSYRPVTRALVAIGEPAIPHLIGALSDRNEAVNWQAAIALGEIGSPASVPVQEALYTGDSKLRGNAAWALAWIGGEDAEIAIKRAILVEQDQRTRKELKEALREVRRR